VGDVMMPSSIQVFVKKNKYNYDLLFEKIAGEMGAADITIANLETPVDGTSKVSGYPKFNARPELLASLKRAGVDIVSVANNHAMDAGVDGLKRTLAGIESSGLAFTGAGRTKAEAGEVRYLCANDIFVGFLSYTYSTNERLPKRRAAEPGVNILRHGSAEDLVRAAEAVWTARRSADLVVVLLHWGDEYATAPTAWQREAARTLVAAGADVILGHHPHVLQPIETILDSDGRRAVVAYSLGNFISSQNQGITHKSMGHAKALRGDGIILTVTARKQNGVAMIEGAQFQPIWSLREKVNGRVVHRPVALNREIARLEALPKLTKDEEDLLTMLVYRRDVIAQKFAAPSPSR
jgi:poly-gamma-glutamate synthesis protein (capsule biosynthesis protein)